MSLGNLLKAKGVEENFYPFSFPLFIEPVLEG
ncbi:Hypothetical protein Cp226_0275 [Corynebacterium pseudotuberculosis]|nr:Hypothetical protein Cp226_0275 [Corynebacterium pseudotuberculosis]